MQNSFKTALIATTAGVLLVASGCSPAEQTGGVAVTPAKPASWTMRTPTGGVIGSGTVTRPVTPAGGVAAADTGFDAFARDVRVEQSGDTARVYHAGVLVDLVVKSAGHVTTTTYAGGAPSSVLDVEAGNQAAVVADDGGDDGDMDGPLDCATALAKLAYYTVRGAVQCVMGAEVNPFCDWYVANIIYWGAKVVTSCPGTVA